MVKRKICIFTGTRAEYGLLKPLMAEIKKDKDLKLQLVVSGMHLSKEFGLTYKEIEKDGFRIDEKVEILLSSDSETALSKAIGLGVIGCCEACGRLKPNVVVILGDRFEAFAMAVAAMISRIPIAHLHGGELTYGLIDEAIRHSITKMSHLHFTSTDEYRKRIIQLGENPDRVFNVGALGIDNIRRLRLLTKRILESELNCKFNKHNLLVTYHPVTLEKDDSKRQIQNLLYALGRLKDTFIIFTKANADTEGRIINELIDEYVSINYENSIAIISMGQLKYLSTLQFIDAVVGNSSSGIIEACSFGLPAVNIGARQAGRLRGANVIDVNCSKAGIQKGINIALSEAFRNKIRNAKNPYDKYGDGKIGYHIKEILKKTKINPGLIKKKFYDLSFNTVSV